MKVLVTGATGGLGELVINELLSRNITVVATSRDAEKAKKSDFYTKVVYKPHEIGSNIQDNLFLYFEKPDAVIHLAWEKLNDYRSTDHLHEILQNHQQFVSNLIKNGIKNLTCAGTCYEYGLREGMLDETMPAAPTLPYPSAKNLLREFIEQENTGYDFSFKWPRIFYVFGETKGRKNLYTGLTEAIKNNEKIFNMSGGEQIRDFLSPREIASIFVSLSLQSTVNGVINCCSGNPVKLKDFVTAFITQHHSLLQLNLGHYPYPDYEPMETWGSTAKLQSAIG